MLVTNLAILVLAGFVGYAVINACRPPRRGGF